jgi:catechol 2,3-dioxygenase-like lactoylglutathione lyase family enzyme
MLQHAALETRRADIEAEVAFWQLLGFTRVEPPQTLAHVATWLQSGLTQIHLLYADEPTVPPAGHVAVIAPEPYAATIAALVTAGHAPTEATPHWGAPRAFVRSPAGHRVEVMAAPPPSASSNAR